jgi:hypothetical protein
MSKASELLERWTDDERELDTQRNVYTEEMALLNVHGKHIIFGDEKEMTAKKVEYLIQCHSKALTALHKIKNFYAKGVTKEIHL